MTFLKTNNPIKLKHRGREGIRIVEPLYRIELDIFAELKGMPLEFYAKY